MAGKVKGIWIKREKGGPMEAQQKISLLKNKGIVNNADQGGERQVTLIEEENWNEAVMELGGGEIDPSHRRANILVSNIPLKDSQGKVLQIGESQIQIVGEAKPCENMDAVLLGLKDKLYDDWKAGAYGIVLNNGDIKIGDSVKFIE